MKIAICDDETRCLEQTTAIAQEYARQHIEKSITVTAFQQPEDLLESAEKIGGYDIYILDIVMPGMNGIMLGTALRNEGYDGKIIYLTSSDDYALDSFQVKAFHYLIKPVATRDFCQTLDEAFAAIAAKKDKCLLVKTHDRNVKLFYDSIMYAELSGRSIIYYLVNGKTVESMSLRTGFTEAVADLLNDPRFVRCGAGMAVNLGHITEIGNEEIVFGNIWHPFLGRKACRELRSAWNEFLFSGGDI